MTPRTELYLANALLAVLLTVAGFFVLGLLVAATQHAAMATRALLWSLPALLAALAGTWLALRGDDRAIAHGQARSAFGLAWRVVAFTFLVYPLLAVAWVLATGFLDVLWQVRPASWSALLGWLPAIVGVAVITALVIGAPPALLLETWLCRRYRARSAVRGAVARVR